jgi:hypothetical protein
MKNMFIISPDFFYFQQKYILKSKFIWCGSHINIFSIKNKKKDLDVCFIRDKGPKCYKEKIKDQNVTKNKINDQLCNFANIILIVCGNRVYAEMEDKITSHLQTSFGETFSSISIP